MAAGMLLKLGCGSRSRVRFYMNQAEKKTNNKHRIQTSFVKPALTNKFFTKCNLNYLHTVPSILLSLVIIFIKLRLGGALNVRWMLKETEVVIFKKSLKNYKMIKGNSFRD